ncbi:MAG: hypothetical protein PHU07_03005 [Acidocella sp.]|nr:hypothetical protein [Acidocella sp.]
MNNLNVGMSWGVFPLFFTAFGLGVERVGILDAVYPTLIASMSDASHPSWRARSLSVYRFWRDLGYAIGALSTGIMIDLFGIAVAMRER